MHHQIINEVEVFWCFCFMILVMQQKLRYFEKFFHVCLRKQTAEKENDSQAGGNKNFHWLQISDKDMILSTYTTDLSI
jgi:hypothetical protein